MQRSEAVIILSRLGHWLHGKNYLAAADGNFSMRISTKEFWITASGIHKGFGECMVAKMNIRGEVLEGTPSTEAKLHQLIFSTVDVAQCVIHAHPPTAIAWSMARPDLLELDCRGFSEVILALGTIPIVSYARPGGEALAESVAPYLPHHRAMILGRHGAMAWGETVQEALNGIERLEHAALILLQAHLLGGAKPLSEAEVSWLRDRRKSLGEKTL